MKKFLTYWWISQLIKHPALEGILKLSYFLALIPLAIYSHDMANHIFGPSHGKGFDFIMYFICAIPFWYLLVKS